ncbi:hypothetical protein Ocin01_04961 [Orchesella cincta]|uniref:Uncharacterized protein n=1 Tax=Orchesella cincta TaxID=48709 RepID=A0A1D2N917_ORCCI|nr:hypothetical protein Ocin01_04961 [Orchesella cincta]
MSQLKFFVFIVFLSGVEISIQAPLRTKEKYGREEAIKIALESTGELIPRPKMVEKIKSDLELIRYLDPNLASRTHVGKWKPGQLYIKEISKEQLDQVQESEFKPIKAISESTMEPGTILMVFAKPYHPEHLSKLLKLRFGFDSYPVPANEDGPQDGEQPDQIVYNHELSTYYFNPVNGYNCKKGCLTQYAVSIFVDENSEEDDFARTAWENNAL